MVVQGLAAYYGSSTLLTPSKATVGGWTAGDRYNRFIWVGVSYQPSDNVNITVALIFPKNNSCNVPSAKRFNGLSAKYPHYSWSSEGLKQQ